MFPLLKLPVEVLQEVLQLLCHHCYPDIVDFFDSGHDSLCDMTGNELERPAALASLCRTSRLLNALATPVLYHHPFDHGSHGYDVPFVRTIFERPDLARHVKKLRYRDWFSHLAPNPEEKAAYVNEIAVPLALVHLRNHWLSNGGLVALLLSKCTDIEELDIELYAEGRQVLPFSAACSLPRLRKLVASHWNSYEGGFDIGYLNYVFSVAPNVTSFGGNAASGVRPGINMGNVREIKLTCCMLSKTDFSLLLEHCPLLETLRFDAGEGPDSENGTIEPRALQDLILDGSPGLKCLELGFRYAFWLNQLDGSGLADHSMLRTLKRMRRLQELSIDTRSLMAHDDPTSHERIVRPDGSWYWDATDSPSPTPSVLIDLLPICIRSLRIVEGYEGSSSLDMLLPAILQLGSACTAEFPNLKAVSFPGLDVKYAGEARAVFESRRVSFSTD